MYKEIDLGNENKLIFFRESNFWNDVISTKIKDSKRIDIVTYNFNFVQKEESGFYNKLIELAEQGINIRLMYCCEGKSEAFIDDVFASEILCVKMPHNHSKIFWSEHFVYIGSANFSFSSNKNYECGFISTNKEIISKIENEILCGDIWENSDCIFKTWPNIDDPLNLVRNAIRKIDELLFEIDLKDYKNSKIFYDCDELRQLTNKIADERLGINASKILNAYEELDYYLECGGFEGFELFDEEKLNEIRKILDNLKSNLLDVERQVKGLYFKYGRYNFISNEV